jgi:CHAD domain-containing protein
MAFRLTRREPLTANVRRLADAELTTAAALLRDDAVAPPLRVHGARKATKRVRALLRLVRAGLAAPRFRAANIGLRDAARGLAAARDAAVALATFDALVPAPDGALAPVRAALLAATDHDAAPEAALASRAGLARAAEALDGVRDEISAALDERALIWKHLEAGLQASYGGGRRAMRAAFRQPEDEAFHAWRKRIKDLWYQTQLLASACEPVLGALERMLADLGDHLGDDHDLTVLAAQPACRDQPELAERIAGRRRSLRADAWQLGRQIHAERTPAFLRRLGVYWHIWRTHEPF